jgi:serine phosphatase RsbU (regulator of sigma subunit)
LREVAAALMHDLPEDMFVTMTYGILDHHTRSFRFARAGHDPLLHYQRASGQVTPHSPKGTAIGLIRTAEFQGLYQEEEIRLEPGDAVVLFTDGITETTDAAGNEFSRSRLMQTLATQPAEDAMGISAAVFDHVNRFSRGEAPQDDQTLVVIKAGANHGQAHG